MSYPAYLRRPLGLLAVFAALALAGVFSWWRLPVELLPRLPYPSLTVLTVYEHAPPQEVESLVSRRLEGVLGTVAGVRRMSGVSSEGLSRLTLEFDWEHDLFNAAAEVREKLDSVADQLPRSAEPPLVLHFDPSQTPVVTLALQAEGDVDPVRLRSLGEDLVKTRLEGVPGVAAVRVTGGLPAEIQVLVDRDRLVAQRLDLRTVLERVERANVNAPAGEIRLGNLEMNVRTVGRFADPAAITRVPLGEKTGGALTLDEIAQVVETHSDPTGFDRVAGRPAVLISLLKEPEANTVEVSRAVAQRLPGIAARLPQGLALSVVEDQAPLVADSLANLRDMVLWGGLLAFLVLLAFLRRPGSALLVVLAAPVSLLAALAAMQVGGVGLNLMSIGGLALGVGMLVDGSVVVLEAFTRHRAAGLEPREAAGRALGEVRGGIISGALTTAAVLTPFLFLTGLAQRLFADFAFTLVASLAVSLLSALFLLPALLVWRSRPGRRPAPSGESRLYAAILGGALRLRLLVVLLGLGVAAAGAWGLDRLGFALLPELNQDQVLVRLTLPPESGLESLAAAVGAAEEAIQASGLAAGMVTRAGRDPQQERELGPAPGKPNQALITVRLTPEAVDRGVEAALASLTQAVQGLPGQVAVLPGGGLAAPGREGLEPPQLALLRGDDLDVLRRLAGEIQAAWSGLGFLSGVASQGAAQVDQLQVEVDRQAAAGRGVTVAQVAQAVRLAVQGEVAGQLIQGDRETDIRVRLRPQDRRSPADLERLPIMTETGLPMPLGQAAALIEAKGPEEILRQERRRAVVLRGEVVGRPFSSGQDAALAATEGVAIPAGYELSPGAEREDLVESLAGLAGALGLALLLIYVILVVQFESLRWPLVVILGLLPVAAGPAAALHLTGLPISALVLLGAVVLLGIAVNNSILLVDYANQLRARGLGAREAVTSAALVRLRPILMSTLTTLLGALPLCLGLGRGASLARPLALTAASGLLVGLLASLIMVPALYLLFSPRDPAAPGGEAA